MIQESLRWLERRVRVKVRSSDYCSSPEQNCGVGRLWGERLSGRRTFVWWKKNVCFMGEDLLSCERTVVCM